MTSIRDIPEIAGLDSRAGMVRIPPETDVPLTDRVRRLIDSAEFRRLARISQLGLVSLVYPGGHPHTVRTLAGRLPAGAVVLAAACLRSAVYRRHFAARRGAVHCGGAAARLGTLAVLPPDRRHSPPQRAAARTVRQQLSAGRRNRRHASRRVAAATARCCLAAVGKTARRPLARVA